MCDRVSIAQASIKWMASECYRRCPGNNTGEPPRKKRPVDADDCDSNPEERLRSSTVHSVFIDNPTGSATVIMNASQVTQCTHSDPTEPDVSGSKVSRKELSVPADIAAVPEHPPVQPTMLFPTTLFGNKQRSFNSDWYSQYRWLEHSRERDAA